MPFPTLDRELACSLLRELGIEDLIELQVIVVMNITGHERFFTNVNKGWLRLPKPRNSQLSHKLKPDILAIFHARERNFL